MGESDAARIEVRDHSLWIAHLKDDPVLAEWLSTVPGGAIARLEVDGVKGDWRKLSDGPDDRPTQGFKPVTEPAKSHWHDLFQSSRGQWVAFRLADDT